MARDRDWHETFKQWTAASSEHEEALGANARGLIRQALHEHEPLAVRRFETYATGSYRNNTNVRYGSDIDVAVVLHDRVSYDLPGSGSPSVAMLGPYPPFHTPMFDLTSFRSEVYHALCERFGGARVGSKAFHTRAGSDVDVTVFYEHRLYTGKKVAGDWEYLKGAKLVPPSGEPTIINWHEQHYENGKAKNDATDGRFKRIVRILKRLRDDMAKDGNPDQRGAASSIASFLIESLVYNVPNCAFPLVGGSYYEDVKAVIRSARNATADDARAKELWEVNGLKRLFAAGQTWTRQQANAFLAHAWGYVGFPE